MASLQASQIADLMTTTLYELGEGKFTDNMSNYVNTLALKRLMKKGKMTFDSGTEVQFNRILATNGSARFVPLGADDIVDIPNVMGVGRVPWRWMTWNWAIERREIAMNRTPRKIVDLTRTRRIAAMGDAIKKFEYAFWRVPAAADDLTAYGLPYFIVKSSTADTINRGFNGTVPSGYTLVANIDPVADPTWANYATQYTAVSKTDLVRKWRKMARFTDFKPLVNDVPEYNTGQDRAYYTNNTVLQQLEEIGESQNENLGKDIASMDDKMVMLRVPIEYAQELDLDITGPVYQVDWGVLGTMGLRDEWMNETVEPHRPGQHTVAATHTDCGYNLLCRDRRKLGVLSTNTTMNY